DGSYGGDEFTSRNFGAARLQLCNRVGNREDVFERRVPSGPVADEDDVIVRIDNPWDNRLAHKVDPLDIGCLAEDVIAHCREAAVADQGLRHDTVARVLRVDSTVDESHVRGCGRRGPLWLCVGFPETKLATDGDSGCTAHELPARESLRSRSVFLSHVFPPL